MWTVNEEFEQPIRHFNFRMSGGSFCAIFTLRLAPCLEDNTVRFTNEVEGEEARYWGKFIEEGVQAFVEQRAQAARPVGYLRVSLVDLKIHPIDSKGHRFKQAAVMAMEKAFESHEITLD